MPERRQIAGYVTEEEYARIADTAERRSVSVASLVARATVWLVRYLELEESDQHISVGVPQPRAAPIDALPVESDERWKFQRDQARRRHKAAALLTAERRVRRRRTNTDET